jgi:hypothetical protein
MSQPTDEYTSPIAPLLEELHVSEPPYARAPLELELSPEPRPRLMPQFIDGEGVWLTKTEVSLPRIARRRWAPRRRVKTRREAVAMMTLAVVALVAAALPLFAG